MALQKIGYFFYDSDEKIGTCPKCGGDIYSSPFFTRFLQLSDEELKELYAGVWDIGFCPKCYTVWMVSKYGEYKSLS
jgi:Zn-finger nucleic acid-binding protein